MEMKLLYKGLINESHQLITKYCIGKYRKGLNEKISKLDNNYQEAIYEMDLKANKNIIKLKYALNEKEITFFGNDYIKNNKKKSYLIINNKKFDLNYKYICEIKKKVDKIKIKERALDKTINLNSKFEECVSLISISGFNQIEVISIEKAFYNCKLLEEIPNDISIMKIDKVKSINRLFSGCEKIKNLPDISNWKTENLQNMEELFSNCSNLNELPDISKWNVCQVENIAGMFYKCQNLKEIPNISKWKLNNVVKMYKLFDGCKALKKIPDI